MMTNSVTLPGTQCKARGGLLARRCLQKSGGSGGSTQTQRMFASLQSADCSPSVSQALSAMEEAEVLARRCLKKFGGSPGGGGTTASTPPVTPTLLSRSIPNAPSFAEWQRPGDSFTKSDRSSWSVVGRCSATCRVAASADCSSSPTVAVDAPACGFAADCVTLMLLLHCACT